MSEISLEQVNKMYRYIKNGMSVSTFMQKFDVNRKELDGILLACQVYGKDVDVINDKDAGE